MFAGLAWPEVALVGAIVLLGGIVMGLAGFGYAVVSTATLATVLSPADAVTIMILPLLASNVSLARELDRDRLRTCVARFWPYVLAATAGTVVGMVLLEAVPSNWLALGIGLFTLGYVATAQDRVPIPGLGAFTSWCFVERTVFKVGVGAVSGFVFGATNVGVQVVAYLDALDLDREVFVGVLALILVGVSGIRVALAFGLGLYGTGPLLALSAAAAVVGLGGVSLGARLRAVTTAGQQRIAVFALLSVIGVRLVATGLGIG